MGVVVRKRVNVSTCQRVNAKELKQKLKGRVVIIGVGNPLKGDDGAGPFFIKQLNRARESRPVRQYSRRSGQAPSQRVRVAAGLALHKRVVAELALQKDLILIDAGEVPENYTGAVTKAKPDTVIIIDAADFSGRPGEIKLFKAEEISGAGLATHSMSLNIFAAYLKQETGAEVFLLAIQPKTIKAGSRLSGEVRSSISNLIKMLA